MSHPPARFLVPILSTLVAAASVLIAAPAPARADTGCPTPLQPSGTGADAQNAMQIATPAHLQYLRDTTQLWSAGKFYELTADIAMPDGCTWTGGLGQVTLPVNTTGFSGSIDGNGHVITGLKIVSTGTYGGFIEFHRSGSIEDLGVEGSLTVNVATTRGADLMIGGLIGYAISSSVARSYTRVDITVSAAVSEDCIPMGCSSRLSAAIGGLVGYSSGPSISNTYALGAISMTGTTSKNSPSAVSSSARADIGGLIGMLLDRQLSKSFGTGSVSANLTADSTTRNLGGLIGYGAINAVPSSTEVAPNTYWDTQTSGTATGVAIALPANGSAGKTTAEMKQSSTYTNWSIATTYSASSTWIICSAVNNGYPALMAMQPTGTCSPPDITSVSPPSGSAAGGTQLTISGTGLAGATSVTVGGATASVVSNSATELVVTTPAGTVGSADVVVTTANGSDTLAGGFTYTAAPAPNGGSSGGGGSTSSGDVAPQASTPRPMREVINPAVPSTPPQSGSVSALVDGNPTSSTVSRVGTTITVSTPSAGTSFFVAPPEPTLVTGVPIRFGFNGGQPTTPVSVFAMSTPVLVATAMTDARGQVSGYITLPASLAAGAHTLVVSGYTADGRPTSAYLGIEVSAPSARSLVRAQAYFAFDSTSLTRRTDAVLRTMVREAQGRNALTTTVGAVRANGATAKDRALALARSKAVADRLRQLGMPGEIRIGSVLPTTLTDARPRRVDITVTYSS